MRHMGFDLLIQLSVNDYDKSIDFSEIKPLWLAKRYHEYIQYNKDLALKADASLYTEFKMMSYLFSFLEQKKLSNLKSFDYSMMQTFFSHLKLVKTKQNKHLSQSSQRLVYTFFKNFIKWLYREYKNEAPSLNIFQKSPYKRNNGVLKSDFFSDNVLKQIKKALIIEEDIYTKTYLLILLYYGLRSMDILSLKNDCLQASSKSDKYDLIYTDHKQKELVRLPSISRHVSNAIQELINSTDELQKRAASNFIFLKETHKGIEKLKSYQDSRLKSFVKRHNIVNETDSLIKITAHMFRRTLATNLQSSGASLESIQSVLNHSSKRSTIRYYIKTKEEDYISQISNLLNEMQIIASEAPIEIDLENKNYTSAIKLSDGYCTNREMLKKDYMCQHLMKRSNCYGCNKMVTTPKFLPYFKELLASKEEALNGAYRYGEHLTQNIEFEKELLVTLISKLEAFQ